MIPAILAVVYGPLESEKGCLADWTSGVLGGLGTHIIERP